jgi:hypothetical protein
MNKILYTILFVSISIITVTAQKVYKTYVNSPYINSLQVNVAGKETPAPVIELHGENQIEINFDMLGEGYSQHTYSITHCNADWTQSSISKTEYMKGFQGLTIDNYTHSKATVTPYTNYSLLLPNDEIQFSISGNYAVNIYDEDNPEKVLFTACFSIVESTIEIEAQVSSKTLTGINKSHQQVSFAINHRNFPIPNPLTELKICVSQNNRRDNMATAIKPSAIQQNRIVYEYAKELIFDAGNEYRRFEVLSSKYNGIGVEYIRFFNPYYHIMLYPDISRNNKTYHYDRDHNGRFFASCSNCDDPNREADYHIVRFTLAEALMPGGEIYLNGELTNNNFDESSVMRYNHETTRYEKEILLKEGHYNYQYLFVPDKESKGQTAPTEGNYFETENEYTIYVYYSPIGARYDKLIGVLSTNSQQKTQN